MRLLLYTTGGCHLCEVAEQLVLPILQSRHISLQKIEISEDAALLERYGMRIPVIRREGQEKELGWPFSEQEFLNYLESGRVT